MNGPRIRVVKTTNEKYAKERLEQLKDAHRACKGEPVLREFEDGAGQKYYEIWICYNQDLSREA